MVALCTTIPIEGCTASRGERSQPGYNSTSIRCLAVPSILSARLAYGYYLIQGKETLNHCIDVENRIMTPNKGSILLIRSTKLSKIGKIMPF